jgi:hypothetical protein
LIINSIRHEKTIYNYALDRGNTHIAGFLTKEVFHLLGDRVWKQTQRTVVMSQREYGAKVADYRVAPWNP